MTANTATPWLAFFDQYIGIVRGAGELLRDCDRLMAQNGFSCVHQINTAGWFWSEGEADGPAVCKAFDAGKKDGQETNTSFGVRLERISGFSDLDALVIKPLAALIGDS